MRISTRRVALAAAALALTALPGIAQAPKGKTEQFPAGKPIEMVTLFGPASASTATARVLADGGRRSTRGGRTVADSRRVGVGGIRGMAEGGAVGAGGVGEITDRGGERAGSGRTLALGLADGGGRAVLRHHERRRQPHGGQQRDGELGADKRLAARTVSGFHIFPLGGR